MALTGQITLFVTLLTLLVWLLFFFAGLPLDNSATTVVALLSVAVALIGRAVWSRIQKDPHIQKDATPPSSPASRP
jgi:hypothetical protein